MKVYKRSKIVKNLKILYDQRGYIKPIINSSNKNVSIIFSKKGSIRSNHYHKKDSHYMYTLDGEYLYFYKALKGKKIKKLKIKKNVTVFTPPNEIHATYFTKDTTLIVISKNLRDQKSYEKDTVRTILIDHSSLLDNA